VSGHEAPATRLPRTRPGRWLARRTLRGRLIAGLLTLLFLACAAVGAVTYAHLDAVLMGGLDADVENASMRYVDCLHSGPIGYRPPPQPAGSGSQNQAPCGQQQDGGTINAVIQPTGTVAAYLADQHTCYLTHADDTLLANLASLPGPGAGGRVPAGPSQVRSVDLTQYGQYEVVTQRFGDDIAVTGMPLAPVTTTLHDVALAEIAVFSAALMLTGLLGTAWVRISLRPLRRVAATATRVTELPLASGEVSLPDRVPDADPRTEVGQVGAAFNRMLGHVESALARRHASENRLRSFAADASHELRTPLAAIRGYAELARRSPHPLPPDVAHALSRVESESARMSVLVDELLLLAQLDAGRPLADEPVDLTRLAIDVTSDARAASPDHRWQLELPGEPVQVRGDEQRLHQVLANLLSNAARHTPAGTAVTVSVGRAPAGPAVAGTGTAGTGTAGTGAAGTGASGTRGQTAIVEVTDNGPGIPAALQSEVFERFVRGDTSRSRAAGSSGLGLAIVRAVTAAHGGDAEVASRPGETRFTIVLPTLTDLPGPAEAP
jgi:two-component system, OmpR family, sensor kinase